MTSDLETRLRNAADKIDRWHDEHCKEDWYPGHVDRDEVNMFREAADELAVLKAKLSRAKEALASALNMVDGDGFPPDWDFLRAVLTELESPC